MKSKVVTREEALSRIHDGQTIMFGDWHGEFAADEIIDGMLEKGIKFRITCPKCSNKYDETIATDDKGEINLTNIEAGTYTVEELSLIHI